MVYLHNDIELRYTILVENPRYHETDYVSVAARRRTLRTKNESVSQTAQARDQFRHND